MSEDAAGAVSAPISENSRPNKKMAAMQTHTLLFPFKNSSNEQVTEVTIRRPKVRDRMAVEADAKTPLDMEVNTIALLTGLVPEDMPLMDMSDYVALKKIVDGFIEPLSP